MKTLLLDTSHLFGKAPFTVVSQIKNIFFHVMNKNGKTTLYLEDVLYKFEGEC